MKTYLLGCGSKVIEPKYKPGATIVNSERKLDLERRNTYLFEWDGSLIGKTIILTVKPDLSNIGFFYRSSNIIDSFTISNYSGNTITFNRSYPKYSNPWRSDVGIDFKFSIFRSGNGVYGVNDGSMSHVWVSGDDTGSPDDSIPLIVTSIRIQ